jgi:two-component system sensor histidine kinase CpxA
MNRLFVRIFLWFWLAMTLVGAALVASVIGTAPGPPPPPHDRLVELTANAVGTAAWEVFSRNGAASVHEFLKRVSSSQEIRCFIVSREVPDLSNSLVPEPLRRAVDDAWRDDKLCEVATRSTLAYAKQVRTTNGHSLVVVCEATRFRTFFEAAQDPIGLPARITAVVLCAGIPCFWLTRFITSPLRQLGGAVARLEHGEFDARVGPALTQRRDEFGSLGVAFDRMAAKIQNLVAAHRQLLQDVSHELRSPLSRLNVALELARSRVPDELSTSLDRIGRESENLNKLVAQLLTLARLNVQSETPAEIVDLATIVSAVVEDARFEATTRDVTIRIDRSEPCETLGQINLLYMAVENVVRNAVRYSPEHTCVEVSLLHADSEGGPRSRILVRDHGPGIPESELARIGTPFRTIPQAGLASGAGMGLTIVRRVVEQHGGKLRLANARDQGLQVEIDLPASTLFPSAN